MGDHAGSFIACSQSILKKTHWRNIHMVFEKIQEIVAEELGKEKEEIKLNTNIQEDLEADSLDLFQIINEIEDEFDVKIETEDGIKTVEDLVKYVEKQQA
jgi:acyl carrier protein